MDFVYKSCFMKQHVRILTTVTQKYNYFESVGITITANSDFTGKQYEYMTEYRKFVIKKKPNIYRLMHFKQYIFLKNIIIKIMIQCNYTSISQLYCSLATTWVMILLEPILQCKCNLNINNFSVSLLTGRTKIVLLEGSWQSIRIKTFFARRHR